MFVKLLKSLLLSERKWDTQCIACTVCSLYIFILIITIICAGIKSYYEDDWSWDDLFILFTAFQNVNQSSKMQQMANINNNKTSNGSI